MRRLMILCLSGVAACVSPNYSYRPAEQATAIVSGHPAARYAIPPERPTGDVRVTTFGVASLRLADGESVPALHARLIVSNSGGEAAWTLDTRDVRIEIVGVGRSGPAFSSADTPGLPVVQIPPGQQRSVDLYFQLPPELEDAGDIPGFDVLWRVQTDARLIAERTPFERFRVEPRGTATVTYGVGLDLVHSYWHHPVYVGRPVIVYRARPAFRFVPPAR